MAWQPLPMRRAGRSPEEVDSDHYTTVAMQLCIEHSHTTQENRTVQFSVFFYQYRRLDKLYHATVSTILLTEDYSNQGRIQIFIYTVERERVVRCTDAGNVNLR